MIQQKLFAILCFLTYRTKAHAHLLNVHAISHSFINATFDLGVLCFACSSHGIRYFGYAYRHSFKDMFSLSTSSTSGRKRLSNILNLSFFFIILPDMTELFSVLAIKHYQFKNFILEISIVK